MPRLPGFMKTLTGNESARPFISFFLRTSLISKPLIALIDTGSPFTVLSPSDILSSRMPISQMQSGQSVKVGGARFYNHQLGAAIMTFKTEKNEPFKADLLNIGALVPTKLDQKTRDEVKPIPSIIGMDFLQQQKLALYCNPIAKMIYLEFVSSVKDTE